MYPRHRQREGWGLLTSKPLSASFQVGSGHTQGMAQPALGPTLSPARPFQSGPLRFLEAYPARITGNTKQPFQEAE